MHLSAVGLRGGKDIFLLLPTYPKILLIKL